VKPFVVHSREYTITDEATIRKVYSVDDKLVGLTKSVTEPAELPTFQIKMPPRDLVIALRVLRERIDERKPTKYTQMIKARQRGRGRGRMNLKMGLRTREGMRSVRR